MMSNRERIPRRRTRQTRGSALIVSLSIMTPMMIIMGSMMLALASHQKEVEQREGRATARTLSASGAHHALALLQEDPYFVGTYQLPLPGGAVQVVIADWGIDGIDNDGVDGVDDPNEEDILEVSAVGWVNPSFAPGTDPFLKYAAAQTVEPTQTLDPTMDPTMLDPTVEGTYQYPTKDGSTASQRYEVSSVRRYSQRSELLVRRVPLDLAVNQTLYIDDPLANLRVDGNSFQFSGFDMNLDGTKAASGNAFPGMGTPGDPADLISQIAAMQEDNIIGLGGTPSIAAVPQVDLIEMVALLKSQADHVFAPGTSLSSPVLGTVADPEVSWAQGDLKIGGTTTGAGVIVVDGDVTITGAFEYSGLVIASGSVKVAGGGNKLIQGGVLCLGSVETVGELVFNGNITMQYSSEGLALAMQAATASLQVLTWMEE